MTNRGTYRFTVKEGHNGQPFLALEPAGASLPLLERGQLSMDLAAGTSLEDARVLANTLNRLLPSIAYTP